MKVKLWIALPIVAIAAFLLHAQSAPQREIGAIGRYQLVVVPMKDESAVLKLDTSTGRTWMKMGTLQSKEVTFVERYLCCVLGRARRGLSRRRISCWRFSNGLPKHLMHEPIWIAWAGLAQE